MYIHVHVVHFYMYTKVQKASSSSKTNPNLGEAIPVPSQAHTYKNTIAKGRVTSMPSQVENMTIIA